jgi:translocator protein
MPSLQATVAHTPARPHIGDVVRQVAVPVFVLASVIINYWVNSAQPFGADNRQVSNSYFTLLNPAPYAFSIWALIYAGTLVLCVYQLAPSRRSLPFWRTVGYSLLSASVFNALFPIAYTQYRVDLAFFIVAGLFLSLLPMYLKVVHAHAIFNRTNQALVGGSIRLYFGWAAVALAASAAQMLQYMGWRSFGPDAVAAAIVVMAVLVIVGYVLALRFADAVVPLVFTWALISIAVEQEDVTVITVTAVAAALGNFGAATLATLKWQQHKKATVGN